MNDTPNPGSDEAVSAQKAQQDVLKEGWVKEIKDVT